MAKALEDPWSRTALGCGRSSCATT
jgi:hypothetical protein